MYQLRPINPMPNISNIMAARFGPNPSGSRFCPTAMPPRMMQRYLFTAF
jgi:hypothetical protein